MDVKLSDLEIRLLRFLKEEYLEKGSKPDHMHDSATFHRDVMAKFDLKVPKYREVMARLEQYGIVEARAIEASNGYLTIDPSVVEIVRQIDDDDAAASEATNFPNVELRASAPIEIQDSLASFQADHPDPSKVAFILMQFGETAAHDELVEVIKGTLQERGIAGLRADEKDYHDDLFPNVLTYIHGCGFGVAVFERIEADDFNPNVSLEVGYMLALRKPVCLLKDKNLKTLQTDLVGKLYKQFDPQHIASTVPQELERWLSDRGYL